MVIKTSLIIERLILAEECIFELMCIPGWKEDQCCSNMQDSRSALPHAPQRNSEPSVLLMDLSLRTLTYPAHFLSSYSEL